MDVVRSLLNALVARLAPPRVLMDRAGGSPYLSRWYLTAGPTMPDGSSPWTPAGAPREGIVWPGDSGFAVHLHGFHRGDDDLDLHNHPWKWSFSFILAGGYREERRTADNRVETRIVRPGHVNIIRGSDYHRVELLEDDAWSIFVTGPKASSWGFWNRVTKKVTPWREFIREKRNGGPL